MSAFVLILIMLIIVFAVLGVPTIIVIWYILTLASKESDKYSQAYLIGQSRLAKDRSSIELNNTRRDKVKADLEVLESRRHKLDSEVAKLELTIEKQRRNLGLPNDNDNFKPLNY